MAELGDFATHGYARAGVRLTEEPVDALARRTSEANRLLAAVHRFDKAHLVMLTTEELIPAEVGARLLRRLRELDRSDAVQTRITTGGGLHSGERLLVKEFGEEVGGWIHLGRSSADLVAVGVRLTLREFLADIVDRVNATRSVMVGRAMQERETVMLAYTHGQQAQPVTYGHWLSMWCAVFERDVARLLAAIERVNQSPAGAAATAGTEFPLDRAAVAELLGFERPCLNSTDAVHSHDTELEALSCLAVLSANLGRISEDLILWSSSEFDYVELADRFSTTSSIMAHKKNPLQPQVARAASALCLGAFVSAVTANKEPTGGAILDQSSAVHQPMWAACDAVRDRCGEMPDLIDSLVLNRSRMEQLARDSWAQATDLSGVLVRDHGCSWRTAHQIVGVLVRRCTSANIGVEAVTSEMVDDAAREYAGQGLGVSETALREALDPRKSVERRALPGGPAPRAVAEALGRLAEQLGHDVARMSGLRESWADADGKLERAVMRIVDPLS